MRMRRVNNQARKKGSQARDVWNLAFWTKIQASPLTPKTTDLQTWLSGDMYFSHVENFNQHTMPRVLSPLVVKALLQCWRLVRFWTRQSAGYLSQFIVVVLTTTLFRHSEAPRRFSVSEIRISAVSVECVLLVWTLSFCFVCWQGDFLKKQCQGLDFGSIETTMLVFTFNGILPEEFCLHLKQWVDFNANCSASNIWARKCAVNFLLFLHKINYFSGNRVERLRTLGTPWLHPRQQKEQ